ncbi:MAG: CBS domain-containing protein [Actinomycetota bacterium]|nr:CBS domain-containing protein [Actinomycetota bacterium]
MTVEHLLQRKGDNVLTVSPGATVSEAAAVLERHRVGALVVSRHGTDICGILSERDLVTGIARHGSEVLTWPVEKIMTAEVRTCGCRDSIDSLMRIMTDSRIRHLPVVDGDRMVGVVSIGDIVKKRLDDLELETRALHDYIQTGR